MKMNMGQFDRMMRLITAFFLIFLAAYGHLGLWAYVVGGVFAVTGIFRMCPLYSILGVQTCALHEQVYK